MIVLYDAKGGGGGGVSVIMTLIFSQIVWMCPLRTWLLGILVSLVLAPCTHAGPGPEGGGGGGGGGGREAEAPPFQRCLTYILAKILALI